MSFIRRVAKVLVAGPPPSRPGTFTSKVHHERTASILGIALGVAFTTCFLTGFASELAQRPPGGLLSWPAQPRDLYRWTQGIHVVTGMASIPLLLAKLWTVYPKLWSWPPARGVAHALERAALVPLVGGALVLLVTGILDIFYWYPMPFFFTTTHYWTAWITIGALIVHIGAKITVASSALRAAPDPGPVSAARRGFLRTVGAASAIVAVGYAGQVVSPLRSLAVLTPRRSDAGPQGVPVNKDARTAGVTELIADPGFTLKITGAVANPMVLDLAALRARTTASADLPITCVEGWSVGARWRGIQVRALLAEAGAIEGFAEIVVRSAQSKGPYTGARINRAHALHPSTLLATELNGEPLHPDHGYPVRFITPNQPGVLQTKWVKELEVIA
jgi:DMSO/TMAO reductase YedYZ molybdopterin-dependent catalytic subunit